MDRFWSKVDKSKGCWEWTGAKRPDGYGNINIDGVAVGAHRVSMMLEGHDIPSGMCVCHHCDNPGCVNPDHLFIGSHLDNARDKERKGRGNKAGEHNGAAKLCEVDVELIRELLKTKTQQAIADWFGIHQTHISRIARGKNWAKAA